MKVLFDTNVVLDLLLDREPFADAAAALAARVETGALTGYVCATAVTTVHYLAAKAVGARGAARLVERLLRVFEVAPVNRAVLEAALASRMTDYEDAVGVESARLVDADAVVTRDPKGFRHCPVPVYAPGALLDLLDAGGG